MSDSLNSPDETTFTARFDDLRAACAHGSPHAAFEKLRSLHADADRWIDAKKRDLFRAPLALSDMQKATARQVVQHHQRLADGAIRVADALASDPGADGGQLAHATGLALHHMAETLKCEMAEKPREPRHFPAMHALIRRAVDGGWQRHRAVDLEIARGQLDQWTPAHGQLDPAEHADAKLLLHHRPRRRPEETLSRTRPGHDGETVGTRRPATVRPHTSDPRRGT